jgi:zinc transport system ATP-binding protein
MTSAAPHRDDPPALELRHVGLRRGADTLLEDISLEVRRGDVHVIVGPNGAGKSTLLSAILGQAAFTGSITARWSGAGRIGFVPQTLAVDRSLPVTVTDFLALARQKRPVCFGIARATREHIVGLLNRVGLPALAGRQLSVLSGGELRRVLLANAIDPTPELLLLDEPSAGLDPTASAAMETMIRTLNREEGVTVLMVSHDLEQVRRLADRVTLLNRSVQRDGPPAAVLTADLAEMLLSGRQPSEPRR